MELRHLQAVDAVLATGSFTAAAAARHVSQPALWGQIKELEAELGVALFVRSGRGVAPTAACLALRPRLRAALDEVVAFRDAAGEIRAGRAAPARIACAASFVAGFLADCIQTLVAEQPDAPFPVIVPITSKSAIETFASGAVDLLCEPRAEAAQADAALMYRIHLVAVGPIADGRETVELRELDGQPVASLPPDSLAWRLLREAGAATGTTVRQVYETRDPAPLLALADRRLCTALLFDETLLGRPAARLLVDGRPIAVPIWLYWQPEESLSPAARALRDVMRRKARERRAADRREQSAG